MTSTARTFASSVPLRAAIVGCGGISHAHGLAAARQPAALRLVACADIVPDRARAFAQRYALRAAYADYQEMLLREQPDLVILATWPNQHEEQVLACLQAGVPAILCEKSLALSAASAARMATAARQAGALLVEGFMWRHHPRTLLAQELLASGRIGNLVMVRAGFHFITADPANWRKRPELGGGVVFDATCYCVNALAAFIAGPPESVAAQWTRRKDGLTESLYATLRYPGGLIAQIESSQLAPYRQPLELRGDRGTLALEHAWTPGPTTDLEIVTGSIWDGSFARESVPAGAADPYECQLLHVCACLRSAARPRFTVEESVRNLAVIDALLRSAEGQCFAEPARLEGTP
jgi:D-xylose 1-dehydrogenase (NADP+, D-xylono-1,5-lactone-forming)